MKPLARGLGPPRKQALGRLLALATILAIFALLGGCAMLSRAPQPVKPDWQALTFSAASDANSNSALAVDVVLVRDKAVLDSLTALSASRYYLTKADLLRTFPDAFTVLAVEITPGQQLRFERKRIGEVRAWAALVFANYAAPGEHRLRLQLDASGYVLQLGAQEFVATAR